MEREKFTIELSQPTAELIEHYADFDAEGRVAKFQIINEELIAALKGAARWLQEGFLSNERLSDVWESENPCEGCAERAGCSITCRRKHSFDKEVYGGLLCGTKPAALQMGWTRRVLKGEVYFGVRLEANNSLSFERREGYMDGAITVERKGGVRIEGREIRLRPWSAALYAMFALHPEGLALASLSKEYKKDFVKIYRNISQSDVKVERLMAQLEESRTLSHLLNNKLSELNAQLSAQGVREMFLVRSDHPKSNNKPYYIPYLQRLK